jgi:hypothetical protein
MGSCANDPSSVNNVRVSSGVTIHLQRPDFVGNVDASSAKSVSVFNPSASIALASSARCSVKKSGFPATTRNVSNTPSQGAKSAVPFVMD